MNLASVQHGEDSRDCAGFEAVRTSGGIEEYRLPANGLRLLFMEQRVMPIAMLMVTYEVGSRHESSGLHGASHMIEHLMFKGTARFNRQQRTSMVDLLYPVGAEINATTWMDRTNYFNLVPVSHLERAAEIEADRMRNLRVDPADLEAERNVVLNEHDRLISEPQEKLTQAVWGLAFTQHPYRAPVIGSRADISGYSRDGLRDYYDCHYRPSNAIVTVIGDVDRRRALEIVRRHFEPVQPAAGVLPPSCPMEPEQQAERRLVIRQPQQPGLVLLAYKSPPGLSPDADALDLLGMILAAGKLSRLYRPLVVGGLAAAVGPHASRLRDPGLFVVQAHLVADQDHAGAEAAIRDAIAAIRRDGVTEAELRRVRGQACGMLLSSRDGPLAIAMQINEAIAAGDWTLYSTAAERYRAVTVSDLQRVAQHYLLDHYLTVGYCVAENAVEAVGAMEGSS
jgi:zinc protease